MNCVADIIDLWPSAVVFADDVGVSPVRARAWKQRDSIPGSFWRRVVDAAEGRGYGEVTLELLARLAARAIEPGAEASAA